MELIGAFATGIAVFAGLMALLPDRQRPTLGLRDRLRGWRRRRMAAASDLLAQARLEVSPRSYLLLTFAAPVLLGLIGLLLSAVMGLIGAGVGLFVPRWYVRWLVGNEARAADDDAPRVLRAMVHRAGAGGTYPELFAAAAEGARHRWVRADFEELLSRYYANEPPKDALAVIRRRQAGRNLALLYDALYVLTATGQPAVAASEVLAELGEATRTNQSIARQAAAESRGLRIQALVLAVVIPLLFVYL
ncbi:MAG TPA: type II secretion system F family protein, partial [Candidatus Limnocylindrales bacterium]|nr:type II secretion system F family protein [Candidatus Limnocylindrales bacterium]